MVGQTRAGRYLKVIYSPDDDGVGIFVITAYDLPDKQLRALRRRLRRRQSLKKDLNRYPKGLNAAKVKAIIDYYDKQSDSEAIAEAEAAYRRRTSTLIEVPVKLLPQVRQLLATAAKAT